MWLFSRAPKIENVSLQRLIPKVKKWKMDTLSISTSRNCPLCSKYNLKTYSLYGWNKKYPKLPDFLYRRACPTCGKSIGITMKIL